MSIRRPRMLIAGALLLGGLSWATIALAGQTPTISGEPRVGETLTASQAAIYKWQRCDPRVRSCAAGQGNNPNGWTGVDGAEFPGARSYALTGADLAQLIRVLVKETNQGTKFEASAPVGPVTPTNPPPTNPPPTDPPPTNPPPSNPPPSNPPPSNPPPSDPPPSDPPPSDPPAVPPPTFQESGNLDPIAGQVWVQLPGSRRAVRIEEVTQVPHGTRVDVGDGRATLISQVRPNGREQEIELWAGAFRFLQRPKRAITVLRLIDSFGPPGAAAAVARRGGEAEAARRKKGGRNKAGRKLWGRGKCRCRHQGRNSSGTARGTFWLTVERPNGTLTRVREGRVLVRDLTRKRRVLVRAGQQYLARSR